MNILLCAYGWEHKTPVRLLHNDVTLTTALIEAAAHHATEARTKGFVAYRFNEHGEPHETRWFALNGQPETEWISGFSE